MGVDYSQDNAVHQEQLPQRVREFTDASGTHWIVRAMRTDHVPGAKRPECLVFDGQSVVRRVWNYPDDWDALPSSALAKLADR